MQIEQIEVEKIDPNTWNPNRMSKTIYEKLTANVKRDGLVEPLVVRPHPKRRGHYEILGGYHRFRICQEELGYKKVPCVVVEGLDDKRAKILSVNLNSMTGEAVPALLSDLLNDLHQDIPLADLEASLPYDRGEIHDFLSLMQLPDGFADELETEAQKMDEEAPAVLTLVLDKRQAEIWARAVEAAKDEVGGSRNLRARTLELISSCYLETRASVGEGGTASGSANERANGAPVRHEVSDSA